MNETVLAIIIVALIASVVLKLNKKVLSTIITVGLIYVLMTYVVPTMIL